MCSYLISYLLYNNNFLKDYLFLDVFEAKTMITDQSLDNGFNEFVQGKHSNLIEN